MAFRQSYDTLQELNGPEGEWVRSAGFQLARALEFSGRPAEALPFYVSALEVAEAEGDPINRGYILHHIGNCEAYAGRWQAAMHAYLRRRCEMPDMTGETVLRTMKLDENAIAVRRVREQAAADGVDLDWLGKT